MNKPRIISSDSHVYEQGDLWTSRIEPKFRDRAIRIVRDEGYDWWYCDGMKIISVQAGAQTGTRFDEPEKLTRKDTFDHVRPGGYIPEEHVKDMDIDGVEVGVLYPSIGLLAFAVPDGDLLSATFATYNDWLAEFCGTYPNRLKGIGMINLDDVQAGVNELERCRNMGLPGALITTAPPEGRGYERAEYEPLWDAAEDLGMPLSLHAATNRSLTFDAANTKLSHLINMDYWVRMSLSDIVLYGVLDRHPNLQIGAVEYELSWVPHFLDRLDYGYTQRPLADTSYHLKDFPRPSDYIHKNVFFGFQEDARGIADRHIIGVDNIMWGSDYPHQESTFPRSRQILDEVLSDCTQDEKDKITAGNAARVYGF